MLGKLDKPNNSAFDIRNSTSTLDISHRLGTPPDGNKSQKGLINKSLLTPEEQISLLKAQVRELAKELEDTINPTKQEQNKVSSYTSTSAFKA